MVYIGFRAKFVEIRSSNEEALVWKQGISLYMEGILFEGPQTLQPTNKRLADYFR